MVDVKAQSVLVGLVDDDSPVLGALRRTLKFELEKLGFAPEFVEAANPLEFLDKLAETKRKVQVVLTDTSMPCATGFDLIELMALRIAEREVPPHLQGLLTDHASTAYQRIAHDTVHDMRMILLSGEYDDSQGGAWNSSQRQARHESLLASLANLEPNPPRGFLHAVLGKPFDPKLLQKAVSESLGK